MSPLLCKEGTGEVGGGLIARFQETWPKFLPVTKPRSGVLSLTKGRDTDVTVFVNHRSIRKSRPNSASFVIVAAQVLTSVIGVEVLVGAERDDPGGINVVVSDVIVSLDVVKVDGF